MNPIPSLCMNYKSEFMFILAILCIDHLSSLGNKVMTFIITSLLSYGFHVASHVNHDINAIHLYHHKHSNLASHSVQIFLEFAWFFGGLWLNYALSLYLNPWIIIFWYLFYTTVHNINYSAFHVNDIHEKHHALKTKNLGPDLWDIVFNTKCDENNIENTDHYIPNIIGCTLLTIGLKYMWDHIENKTLYIYAFHCMGVLSSLIYISITVYLVKRGLI
jgi:hypothetical protein